MGEEQIAPRANGLVRQEFGARSMEVRGETASTAVAAQAQASVQARYIMALQRPRDVEAARVRLLNECRRPSFAATAIYHKPIGKGIEGPSIRLAEACVRLMGNILSEAPTVYDDDFKRIVRIVVTDLETNATFQSDIVIEKTVERSKADDRLVLGERTNSRGAKTYIVAATEDELLNKQNALISKALRTNGLRLVPADIVEEALALCRAVRKAKDALDPAAARKWLIDAFAKEGLMPEDLRAYLEKDLEKMTVAEIDELRSIGQAIHDGETTWKEVMAARKPKSEPAAPQTETTPPPEPKREDPPKESPQKADPPPVAEREPGSDDVPVSEVLRQRMLGAKNEAELKKCAADIKEAQEHGAITEADRQELAALYGKRQAEVRRGVR